MRNIINQPDDFFRHVIAGCRSANQYTTIGPVCRIATLRLVPKLPVLERCLGSSSFLFREAGASLSWFPSWSLGTSAKLELLDSTTFYQDYLLHSLQLLYLSSASCGILRVHNTIDQVGLLRYPICLS